MKPILFNPEMVKAILAGRKTTTRRIVKLDLGLADIDKNDKDYFYVPDRDEQLKNPESKAEYDLLFYKKREIKFRGRRIDNGEWVYGGHHRHITRQISPIGDKLREEDVKHLIIQSGFADWNMPRPLNAIEVIPETVGQYLGRKDVNSKEIYEGDIVKATLNGDQGITKIIELKNPIDYSIAELVDLLNWSSSALEKIGDIYETK